MENDDLQQGIAALKAGDVQKAQALLARVVQKDPRSEQGWLWLGYSLSDLKNAFSVIKRCWLLTHTTNMLARHSKRFPQTISPPSG